MSYLFSLETRLSVCIIAGIISLIGSVAAVSSTDGNKAEDYSDEVEIAWEEVYLTPEKIEWEATCAVMDEDRSIYVGGYVCNTEGTRIDHGLVIHYCSGYRYVVLKYDRHGELEWEIGTQLPLELAVSPEGILYVASAGAIQAFDSEGIYLNQFPFGVTRYEGETINSIAVDADENIYATGEICAAVVVNKCIGRKALTVKLAGDGSVLWSATYDGLGIYDSGKKLIVDDSGNVYVAIVSAIFDKAEGSMLIVKYGPDGELLWKSTIASNTYRYLARADLALDRDGNVTVLPILGTYYGIPLNVARFDPAGNLKWHYSDTLSAPQFSSGNACAIDNEGNVLVTGFVGVLPFYMLNIKIDNTGQEAWRAIETSGGWGIDVAADEFGNTFVTGGGFRTFKYSATGSLLWKIAPEHGSQEAVFIGPDDDFNLYLTGTGSSGFLTAKLTDLSFCEIAGARYANGETNPDNVCQICDLEADRSQWTGRSGMACDDGLFCNGADVCEDGQCAVHDGDPCEAGMVCDEGSDVCEEPGDDDDEDASCGC